MPSRQSSSCTDHGVSYCIARIYKRIDTVPVEFTSVETIRERDNCDISTVVTVILSQLGSCLIRYGEVRSGAMLMSLLSISNDVYPVPSSLLCAIGFCLVLIWKLVAEVHNFLLQGCDVVFVSFGNRIEEFDEPLELFFFGSLCGELRKRVLDILQCQDACLRKINWLSA